MQVSDFLFDDLESLSQEHPEGKLEKYVIVNPNTQEKFLYKSAWTNTKGDEILFYQVWCEVVASQIGHLLGLPMANTCVGYGYLENVSFECGVLSLWFKEKGEQWISGANFLRKVLPERDHINDKTHFLDVILENTKAIEQATQYWIKNVLFCTLIGNQDFHPWNWEICIDSNLNPLKFSPLYDNGTSLGFRVEASDFSRFKHQKYFEKYKLKMTLSDLTNPKDLSVKELLHFFVRAYDFQLVHSEVEDFIQRYRGIDLDAILKNYTSTEMIPENHRLTQERALFMRVFMDNRITFIQQVLNDLAMESF